MNNMFQPNQFLNRQYNPYQPYVTNNYVQNNNGIVWVQGVEGAKAYQMQPNSNMILMDSETENRFYIKVSDNVGMCNLRTFSFEEITNTPKDEVLPVDMSQYITRDEFEQAINNLGGKNNAKQSIQSTKSANVKPTITE